MWHDDDGDEMTLLEVEAEAERGWWKENDGSYTYITDMPNMKMVAIMGILKKRKDPHKWLPWFERFKDEMDRRRALRGNTLL